MSFHPAITLDRRGFVATLRCAGALRLTRRWIAPYLGMQLTYFAYSDTNLARENLCSIRPIRTLCNHTGRAVEKIRDNNQGEAVHCGFPFMSRSLSQLSSRLFSLPLPKLWSILSRFPLPRLALSPLLSKSPQLPHSSYVMRQVFRTNL